ncbi:MAG: 16S rRNA (cytosine(1402)-N(4))-methyltransferase RsmH [Planctomycetes bacterium]|nr:16S rRNA (cytosine(1402)-N(4))-methyltransferase RsmH [Planctomycetota bacterium]
MEQPQPGKHKRRKRYAGTHPRTFEERYKEHDPTRFPEITAHVRAQGRTPAGSHVPILLQEVLTALTPQPGETVLDCTLGYGGHAAALARTGATVIAVDLDGEELARTRERLAQQGLKISAHQGNFAGIGAILQTEGLQGVDCLLADLGVSSMQLDKPERGFGFKGAGPLDMRMDRTRGRTAADLVAQASVEELEQILHENGDVQRAAELAAALKARPPRTTRDLADTALRAAGINPVTFRRRGAGDKHPAAPVFQALRMAVNREPANLEQLLRSLPWVLNPGGRAALITFHSGEERRVRDALAAGLAEGLFDQADVNGIRPTAQEVRDNPRARSARLFVARRAGNSNGPGEPGP